MDDSKSSADDGEINAGCGIKSRVTMKDAIAFMDSVKTVLGAKSDGFVNLFKDYTAKRIDAKQVISGAIPLLKGHGELVAGFNLFLPQAHEISVPLEDDAFAREMEPFLEDALKFIKIVKEQLNAEQFAYFLNLLHEHQNMRKSFEDLYSEV
ncbi:paired amphipathic helix Sin3-like 4 [Olea europaea subsp. europaea]|uniref:Paired amphipathic helix Sin3-like 4 n=1 Tax=Olea europaea subsp. europaea TaxID=158383 RepID=A0A8S0RTM7_OLEEU|nr:paired amphipathic helix Sin3-like 4 [Olea europaea subsp. europaea]